MAIKPKRTTGINFKKKSKKYLNDFLKNYVINPELIWKFLEKYLNNFFLNDVINPEFIWKKF